MEVGARGIGYLAPFIDFRFPFFSCLHDQKAGRELSRGCCLCLESMILPLPRGGEHLVLSTHFPFVDNQLPVLCCGLTSRHWLKQFHRGPLYWSNSWTNAPNSSGIQTFLCMKATWASRENADPSSAGVG